MIIITVHRSCLGVSCHHKSCPQHRDAKIEIYLMIEHLLRFFPEHLLSTMIIERVKRPRETWLHHSTCCYMFIFPVGALGWLCSLTDRSILCRVLEKNIEEIQPLESLNSRYMKCEKCFLSEFSSKLFGCCHRNGVSHLCCGAVSLSRQLPRGVDVIIASGCGASVSRAGFWRCWVNTPILEGVHGSIQLGGW